MQGQGEFLELEWMVILTVVNIVLTLFRGEESRSSDGKVKQRWVRFWTGSFWTGPPLESRTVVGEEYPSTVSSFDFDSGGLGRVTFEDGGDVGRRLGILTGLDIGE